MLYCNGCVQACGRKKPLTVVSSGICGLCGNNESPFYDLEEKKPWSYFLKKYGRSLDNLDIEYGKRYTETEIKQAMAGPGLLYCERCRIATDFSKTKTTRITQCQMCLASDVECYIGKAGNYIEESNVLEQELSSNNTELRKEIAERIRSEHKKYAHNKDLDWAEITAAKIIGLFRGLNARLELDKPTLQIDSLPLAEAKHD